MAVVQRDPQVRPAAGGRQRDRASVLASVGLLAAVVAILAAALLPLAPVKMNMPTVTWPQAPLHPQSTMLELTNQQPLGMDLRFSCSVVVKAASAAGGVVFSTLVAGQPAAPTQGLFVAVRSGRLNVTLRGEVLLDEPVRTGPCLYTLAASGRVARLARDGAVVGSLDRTAQPDAHVLPDVDVLATSLTGQGLSPEDELRAVVRVDDQFNTTPTAVKKALVGLLVFAVLVAGLALWRLDRKPPRTERLPAEKVPAWRRVHLVDLGVPAVMVLWLFIAPASDDDGYYAAMARNASKEGFVGNYYQLMNQSFTPFTWFYRVLGWWERVGNSPVLLRVPALLVGLLTWLIIRRFARRDALPARLQERRLGATAVRWALAVAFLAWWLPYGMGVRPEAIVGFLAVTALLCVRTGLRQRRLVPVACGVAAAGLAVVCHPTGFVALGPVLAGLPGIIALVKEEQGLWPRLSRVALLVAPGALASVAAFSDGTLNDFFRGQQIFLSIQDQNNWYDEIQRYSFLFSSIPMGSYAKRVPVVLGLLALAWFVVVSVAAHARRIAVPEPLTFAAQSLALSFLLLWITPSKWTHHFGALAGVGPVFVGLFLASSVALVSSVWDRNGLRIPAAVTAVGSCVLAFSLAFHGPNDWAYSWLLGMPHPRVPPSVSTVTFDSPVFWLFAFGVAVVAVVLFRRRRGGAEGAPPAWLTAIPVLSVVFLVLASGYLVGSFALAAKRTIHTYSPGASSLTDPLSGHCAAAGALRVGDVERMRQLPEAGSASDSGAATGFVEGGGFFAPDPPPRLRAVGAPLRLWGSLPGDGAESSMGRMTSPWFRLPDRSGSSLLGLLVAGRLDGGNRLSAQFGRSTSGSVSVLDEQTLQDGANAPDWRTIPIDPKPAMDQGADLVRLSAVDGSGGPGGWLAYTAPGAIPWTSLRDYLPASAAVGTAWQIAFNFPCQRQPAVRSGITEPVGYGVLWGDGAEAGLDDNTWQVFRGGLFAPVRRTSSVVQLVAGFPSAPDVHTVQVFRFMYPYPVHAYSIRNDRVSLPGWQGPGAG